MQGRFYFGELLEDSTGCDENVSALHSGIAEVAAAKARMFVNKPDGMVREDRGPYNDPQHPYFYEEEDAWMAPGFINQFYEVPEYWKRYVHDVDQERGMWLNSFYKAPLRLPMPAELEYWWSKDQNPEFILINKEPDPENDDPSQRYPEDPLILHTPTGRIINYVEDEEHGIRLFWQPPLKDGEEVDPSKAEFLPLGFDDFYGREVIEKRESFWKRFVVAAENACRPAFERFDKWIEEKKKDGEMKMKLIEKELDLIEAEICLEEAIEEMDEDLKTREKEEQMMVEMGLQEEREETFELAKDEKKGPADVEAAEEAEEEEVEEEEEEEEDSAPSSFGNVTDISKNGQKRNKPGDLPFATSSLGLYPSGFISAVPSTLQRSFAIWKQAWSRENASFPMDGSRISPCAVGTVTFPRVIHQIGNLKASKQEHLQLQKGITSDVSSSQLRSLSRIISSHTFSAQWESRPSLAASRKSRSRLKEPRPSGSQWLHEPPDGELSRILSLHDQAYCRGYPMETLASAALGLICSSQQSGRHKRNYEHMNGNSKLPTCSFSFQLMS
ncbi:hypothetical protein SAY86_022431 [Trapa natans]|uniref:Uncharacterized protein n=1 Tax=Trapa natans TaxID=22666 RepID=A0AAN7LT04_TRANT|nr:hypothetical protein SAY86_022431 [Trapa natans]